MRYRQAIVIGASSGIGAELVRQLALQGCKVAAVARRMDRLEALAAEHPSQVLAYAHDVRNGDEVAPLFQRITQDLGGLDLVIYAAGVMPLVGPEEFDWKKDREMLETNLLGAVAWLNQAAIRFGAVGAGTIVGIGSVAGDRGRRGQPVYNASKAGLATYLEALRNRLHRKGVTVVTIKPGPVATDLLAGRNFKNPMPVDAAAAKILKLSQRPGEHYLKLSHRVFFGLIRLTPGAIFRRLNV